MLWHRGTRQQRGESPALLTHVLACRGLQQRLRATLLPPLGRIRQQRENPSRAGCGRRESRHWVASESAKTVALCSLSAPALLFASPAVDFISGLAWLTPG